MLIKPRENIEYSELEEKAFRERNIVRSHRDIYIYDETYTENASFGILKNQLFAGVVQVNKLLVRGMPNEEGFFYDRDINARVTFVKAIYIYNAFMNADITDINERFSKAVLRPILGVVNAYTDTKQLINASLNNALTPVENQFGITIFNFENGSLMSILCNPIMVQDGIVAKVSRLDIPDPRFNIVRYLNKQNSSDYTSIPTHLTGVDLIGRREAILHSYQSYYKNNDSFSEENLLNTSRNIFMNNKIRFNREESGLIPFENEKIRRTNILLDRKRALKSLIIDITKAGAYSLFESFTMMYETGKKSGFKGIKPPFKQYHIEYMEERMSFVHLEFIKLCEKITELFGRVRILLYVNDVEHVVKCIFLDDNTLLKDTRVITLRMSKLECINEYILESMYGKHNNINEFREAHELDLLNYYSYIQGDSKYYFEGKL